MGNYKWNTNDVDKTLPYVVVLFRSRNKDNKNIPDFKERKRAYFRTADKEKIYRDFNHFIEDGVPGEMCRCYISLNARDVDKVKKAFLHTLIDEDEFCFEYIEPKLAGIAARRENAAEKKWFFDFDSKDILKLQEFIKDILAIDENIFIQTIQTPHGFAVVVDHGFDTRTLLEKWKDVTLKRDDLICEKWGTK